MIDFDMFVVDPVCKDVVTESGTGHSTVIRVTCMYCYQHDYDETTHVIDAFSRPLGSLTDWAQVHYDTTHLGE